MKVEYAPRGTGRTTKMVERLSKNKDRVLLTFSQREETRLKELYPDLASRIYWWKTYISKTYGYNGYENHRVLVDNADYILEQVIGNYIEVGTFTKEQIVLRGNEKKP